jgi:hypothetical protein
MKMSGTESARQTVTTTANQERVQKKSTQHGQKKSKQTNRRHCPRDQVLPEPGPQSPHHYHLAPRPRSPHAGAVVASRSLGCKGSDPSCYRQGSGAAGTATRVGRHPESTKLAPTGHLRVDVERTGKVWGHIVAHIVDLSRKAKEKVRTKAPQVATKIMTSEHVCMCVCVGGGGEGDG